MSSPVWRRLVSDGRRSATDGRIRHSRPDRGLCDRVCALLAGSRASVVVCDVCDVDADAVTIDALARLQLAALRHGCRVCLCNASQELRDLVAFMGLTNVFAE
jgi:STAS domain